jgi:CPA2 family monovalent cation:H+ antiporter-2
MHLWKWDTGDIPLQDKDNVLKYDEAATRRLATDRHDKQMLIAGTLKEIEIQEKLLRQDLYAQLGGLDHSWESAERRKEENEN